MQKFIEKMRYSPLYQVFNLKDEHARGRSSMLASTILCHWLASLSTGALYTGFLMINGIDLVNFTIISFIPLIANCFSVFSPLILERFKKRKLILALSRIAFYTINILGLTVMPLFVKDPQQKMFFFGLIIFIANLINALFSSGYAAWHLNFIPNTVRAHYFSFQQVITTAIGSVVVLSAGFIADAFAGTPNEGIILYIMRFVAYIFAILDVIVLSIPKEYPYPKKVAKLKFSNIFTLAFANKKFLLTMVIIAIWNISAHFTAPCLTYYLKGTIGVQYFYINLIDALYAVFLIIFSKFWRRIVIKWDWLKTFAITAAFSSVTYLFYSFITPGNYLILMTAVRFAQHFIGVGLNLAYANMPFINMPEEDRTNFVVFFTLTTNLFGFFGASFSTFFISYTSNFSINIFGFSLTSVPMLLILQGFGQFAAALFVMKNIKRLKPENT